MFTGLIEEVGNIKAISKDKIDIYCKKILEGTNIGDSISVNGVCLTITETHSENISFHVSSTTKEHSRFKHGDMRVGEEINLERALTPMTRLGGHIVSGHVDGISKIISVRKKGAGTYFEFLYPPAIKNLIAPKGSVTIDGISLTISDVLSSSFVVTIIPQTIQTTNLKQKRVGNFVHIEADIFARYIYNILKNGGLNEKHSGTIEKFYRR